MAQVVEAVIEKKYRMSRPLFIPIEIWEVISDCWNQHPDDRPTFKVSKIKF